jgi:hypothetical protein
MNHHALNSGHLEFPMMGWPYYVRNSTGDLAFNDLYTPKTANYATEEVAGISFVGFNYPTMKEVFLHFPSHRYCVSYNGESVQYTY